MEFPEDFLNHIATNTGFDAQAFRLAHEQKVPTSIRLNPLKPFEHTNSDKVPWCNNAYYLAERPQFVFDPLHHAGVYYVQEASSMFTGYIFNQFTDKDAALNILDLCAAPGGKSTLIAGIMNKKSLLVSNEVIQSRVHILKENIDKCGNANVVVSHNDPKDYSKLIHFFDVIIIDAPCSGSGLFRKDPNAMQEWSLDNVAHCSKRQQRIVEDAIPCLKPGGILIYATCSYSFEEDEGMVKRIIESGFEVIKSNDAKELFSGIVQNEFGYRFYPDKIRGEGFFISALRKEDDTLNTIESYSRKYEKITALEFEIIAPYINKSSEIFFYKHKEVIYAIPEILKPKIQALGYLHLIKSGTAIGTIKNGILIPDHELALSELVATDLPFVELDELLAIDYLRKNTIFIDSAIMGWCLMRFKGINLGWAKLLPNRVNNYYPVGWRIRK